VDFFVWWILWVALLPSPFVWILALLVVGWRGVKGLSTKDWKYFAVLPALWFAFAMITLLFICHILPMCNRQSNEDIPDFMQSEP
jgi:hypothetical protein